MGGCSPGEFVPGRECLVERHRVDAEPFGDAVCGLVLVDASGGDVPPLRRFAVVRSMSEVVGDGLAGFMSLLTCADPPVGVELAADRADAFPQTWQLLRFDVGLGELAADGAAF